MNQNVINFLIRLKGNSLQHREKLTSEFSRVTLDITRKLYKEGYVQSYRVIDNPNAKATHKQTIDIHMRYYFDKPIFHRLKFLSTPNRQIIMTWEQLARLTSSRDTLFFHTVRGVKTLMECKEERLGGQLMFKC